MSSTSVNGVRGQFSANAALKRRRDEGGKAFIPYITAGDPSLSKTKEYVGALVRAGADIIELGIPFSDPMADGPVNQRSAERALAAGITLSGVIELVAELRASGERTPIVLFTYFNPVFKMGAAAFAKAAGSAGVSAVLVLDLPLEEAREHCATLDAEGVEVVFLAAPTTPAERFVELARVSTGFIYYVSRMGVTGVQSSVSSTLGTELDAVRAQIQTPIAVGFGISTVAQAEQVAWHADAVVVGSALVQMIAQEASPQAIESFAREIIEGIRRK